MTGKHATHPDIIKRLKRITGHLQSVTAMVEGKRSCPEVLQQMSAVLAALEKARKIYLEDHLTGCIVEAVSNGDADRAIEELTETFRMVL